MSTHDPATLAPLVQWLNRGTALTTGAVAALMALPFRLATAESGTHIARQGEAAPDCVLLISGFACRQKLTDEGGRQIVAFHFKNDVIGLVESLFGTADHGVQLLSAAKVAFIPGAAIFDLAARYPDVGRAMMREAAIETSIAREWILNVGRRNARQRIAHLLCELAMGSRRGAGDGATIDGALTQEQIADATGLTSVHVNRTIQGLRADGLIANQGRTIVILDWAGLQRCGDFSADYLHQDSS